MYLRLLLTVFKHPYYLLYFFLLYSARLPSLSITSDNLCLRPLSSPWQWLVLWLALSSKGASDSDLVWRSLPKFMNFLSNVHPIYVWNVSVLLRFEIHIYAHTRHWVLFFWLQKSFELEEFSLLTQKMDGMKVISYAHHSYSFNLNL